MSKNIRKKRAKRYILGRLFNYRVWRQRKYPLEIPIIIINYNQLFYLQQLVTFLLKRGFKNIIIVDNKSDYPPLLEYYNSLRGNVVIEYMEENYGHMVFFDVERLFKKYGKGYYMLTDADILPNTNLPEDFVSKMIELMDLYYKLINKVGFALDISDIPDYFPLKKKVLNWEKDFWKEVLDKEVYLADIDTTFALYPPNYKKPRSITTDSFYRAIRIGGNFTAKHGGWYLDPNNLSEERKYYFNTANSSASWKFNKDGAIEGSSNY